MFQKRLYHSIRFWLAVIWQLIIPLLFVTWALVVAKVVPRLATETSGSPSRLLSIDNSAPSRDVILFYASFDSANPIAFEVIAIHVPIYNLNSMCNCSMFWYLYF